MVRGAILPTAPLIPPAKTGGRPRSVDVREVVNGILYITRGGNDWRMLPHDLPPWQTAYYYFRRWQRDAGALWADGSVFMTRCVSRCAPPPGALPNRAPPSSTVNR